MFTDDLGYMALQLAMGVWRVAPVPSISQRITQTLINGIHTAAKELTPKDCAIAAAGAYAVYQLAKVPVPYGKLVNAAVPGAKRVRNLLTGKPALKVDPEQVANRQMVLESRRTGSDEVELCKPRHQVLIGEMVDGDFTVIGSAVRMGEHLVAPDHVMGSPTRKAYGKCVVDLAGRERLTLATDLVAIHLSEKDWSRLQVSPVTLAPVDDRGSYVSIVGPVGKGTTGVCRTDPTVFGRVVYTGTTLGGYSGSAYMLGNQMVGIHQMGGAVNGGYSASFAWMALQSLLRRKPEASEDWLMQAYKKRSKIAWDSTSGDPDEVRVRVGGLYSTVERASLIKAFGPDWETKLDKVKAGPSYGDYESTDAKNGMAPQMTISGASSTSEQEGDSLSLQGKTSAQIYAALSQRQQKNLRKYLKSLETLNRGVGLIDGPAKTVVAETA